MEKTIAAWSAKAIFLKKFLQSPRHIGSITPSSSYLARAMVKPVEWQRVTSIVELGAGTGAFTQYIHQLKHPLCKAVIFEQDDEMRARLQSLYPGLDYRSNAEHLCQDLQELGIGQVDCILSGLPFTVFPARLRQEILQQVVRSLKPGGLFIAFQYSPYIKRELERHFRIIDVSLVPLNLPPAFVYTCRA